MCGGVYMFRKTKVKEEQINMDPFGSYTGCPVNPEEKPVQDADDL